MEDKFVEKRTIEETRLLFEEKVPQYIVLNKKIHRDIKGNQELDITLFDLSADSEQGAIVSLNVKDFKTTNRIAQNHEIDRARALLKRYRESIWSKDLNS